jgi:hypothetical protein
MQPNALWWMIFAFALCNMGVLFYVLRTLFLPPILPWELLAPIGFVIIACGLIILMEIEHEDTPAPAPAALESTTSIQSPSPQLCPCPESTTEGPPQ